MHHVFKFCLLLLFCITFSRASAQDLKTSINDKTAQDSLRKKLDKGKDSVIYTSKYIRYTKLSLTKDSVILLPLDTSLVNVQHFSPLLQPEHPTISNGNLGLAAAPLLYEPSKRIGYDIGFHALDYYAVLPDNIKFYEARTQFTNLYFVTSGQKEQVFKGTHSQNINKNLNIGFNFNRADNRGIYAKQRGDNLNIDLFSWYRSANKRYNLWATVIFNTMRAYENGSLVQTDIFDPGYSKITRDAEQIKLKTAQNLYRKNTVFLKQTYYVGRIDSAANKDNAALPTNKIAYTFAYNNDSYSFNKNEADPYNVLPPGIASTAFTKDSTHVQHVGNEFMYSFFLRGKNKSIIKNELKIDAGIRHDFYKQEYAGFKDERSTYERSQMTYQNITLLGAGGYRFSDNIDLNLNVQQILQGENIGDYLYEAKSKVLLSKSVGHLELGAYAQNQSPARLFNYYHGNHYKWGYNNFKKTKVANASFKYVNDQLEFSAGANYFLTSNYLYFGVDTANQSNAILPKQAGADISLIRIEVSKKWRFGSFVLENFLAYQKTDQKSILRTPEFYTYNSFYLDKTFFKVLKTNVGFDVRYNTAYANYSYSPATAQYYVGENTVFKTTPIVDVFAKANLKRTNIFIKYSYANQNFPLTGYYTVNRYPMQDSMLKFGVSWNFYD
ncbi:MAG: putative porin [Pedobacter sp.]|nr:putative porin [Pedobacter sp.]